MYFSQNCSNSNSERARHLINLGLTNRRIHDLERVTITGKCCPTLISTNTKTMSIPEESKKELGKLLVYIIDNVLPSTTLPEVFNSDNKVHNIMSTKFGKQLLLTKETGLERFTFEAISIVLNKDLKPHCDKMNPSTENNDYTMSISMQLPIDNIPDSSKQHVLQYYKHTVPVGLIIYRRKCIEDYSLRVQALIDYETQCTLESDGRSKWIKLLSSVGTDADYVGRMFNKSIRREYISSGCFKVNTLSKCTYPIADFAEAVDKMVSVDL